ncbi:MAG: hypothetical protein AB1503_04170 [Bacillota bacterium]|nr:hypothetical protein [Bacillota bacterium]
MLQPRHRQGDEPGWFDWWATLYYDENFGQPRRCPGRRLLTAWDCDVAAALDDDAATWDDDYPPIRWSGWSGFPLLL